MRSIKLLSVPCIQLSENAMNVFQIFNVYLTELFCNFIKSLFISNLANFISFRLYLVVLGIVSSATTTAGKTLKRESLHISFKFLISGLSVAAFSHSHKKWKDGLKTRAVLLIFSFELEITVVVLRIMHQNTKKW